MPKNPYFDDEDEDYGSEEFENLDNPESYKAAQNTEEYPAWAQITSDLAEEPPAGFEDVSEANEIAEKVVASPILRPKPAQPQPPVSVPIPVPVPTPSPASSAPVEEYVEQENSTTSDFSGVPVPVPPPIEPRKANTKPKMMPRERTESSPEVPRSSRYVEDNEEELPRRRKPLRDLETSKSSQSLDDYDSDEVLGSLDDEDDEEYAGRGKSFSPPQGRKTRRSQKIEEKDFDKKIDDEDDEDLEEDTKKKKNGGGLFAAWKKDSPKSKSSNEKSSKKKEESSNKYSGGRGKVLILRGIVWVVIVLVMFLGFRQVFFPPTPSIPAVAEQVATDLGITDFPEVLGGSLALEFANAYLTFNPKDDEAVAEREKQILSFLPSNADVENFGLKQLFAITGDVQQVIVDGPFLAERPSIVGNSGFFVVAATIANVQEKNEGDTVIEEFVNEKRIYLTVPVVKDELGRVAVGGAPGFTPGQARAAQGQPFDLNKSDEATNSFSKEIPNLFTAWAESDQAGLGRYLAPNADEVTRTGLNNTVQYQDYRNLIVQEIEDPLGSRYATVDIIWNMDGNIFTQQYLLVIYETQQGEDKLWFVISIRPSLTSLP